MTRAVLVPLLLSACASHDPPPAAKEQPPGSHDAATAWLWRSDAVEPADPSYLLGVVGQHGIAHCPGGGYDRQWLAVRPVVGRVGLSGPPDEVLEPVMDHPVVAIGTPISAPERPPLDTEIEPCPPMQMRDDWRETPRGMRIARQPGAGIDHFEVSAVRELYELRAQLDGDHVVVTLHNPVPVALREVELRVHYEGCFGKPGTTVEVSKVGPLGVGAQTSTRVAQIITRSGDRPGRNTYRASSVQLVAEGEAVFIDLDAGLSSLGATVECPPKK